MNLLCTCNFFEIKTITCVVKHIFCRADFIIEKSNTKDIPDMWREMLPNSKKKKKKIEKKKKKQKTGYDDRNLN